MAHGPRILGGRRPLATWHWLVRKQQRECKESLLDCFLMKGSCNLKPLLESRAAFGASAFLLLERLWYQLEGYLRLDSEGR